MFTLTERFFIQIKSFIKATAEITNEYAAEMDRAKAFTGSDGGKQIERKAAEARDTALKKEREDTWKAVSGILSDMRANNVARKLALPTPEMYSLLNVLKMRTTLTADDLEQAAASLEGNAACLAALADIAKENKIHAKLPQPPLSTDAVTAFIDTLENSTRTMLNGGSYLANREPKSEADCLTRFGALPYKVEQLGGNGEYVNLGKTDDALIERYSAVVNGLEAVM